MTSVEYKNALRKACVVLVRQSAALAVLFGCLELYNIHFSLRLSTLKHDTVASQTLWMTVYWQ